MERKIKILYVSTSSLAYNGVGIFILNYIKNIDKSKVKIDVVAPNKVDNIIKTELNSNKTKVYELEYKNKKMRQKRPIKYAIKLYKILKNENYDIIHVHGSSAAMCIEMIIAKMAGCKIRIAHSHNTKATFGKIDKILRPIFNKTYTHAFACEEEAGKWLFGEKSYTIIKNGQNIDKFKYNEKIRGEIRDSNGFSEKIVLGHVGNFNEQKNHDFLIDIFYNLSKSDDRYCLLLIGEGHLQESIKQRIKELGLQDKVLLVGQSKEVEKWLQAMDIMLLPSKFEGFPNVLVEWQISGLPCIVSNKVTDKVKLTDLVQFASIDNGTGEWVEKIKNVQIKDRKENQDEIIKKIKENGFDIKENAKKLEEIYIKLYNEENGCEND